MISHAEFEIASKSLLHKYETPLPDSLLSKIFAGWIWREHAQFNTLSYLTRNIVLYRTMQEVKSQSNLAKEENDIDITEYAPDTSALESLSSIQSIVYSSTYQLPVFYFTVHDSNGSPLSLEEIMQSSLFHCGVFDGAEITSFALQFPSATFPALSQGDHPITGTPSWFLHPCEMGQTMAEVMIDMDRSRLWTEEQCLVRELEAWFMVVGNTVDLRA